MIVFYQTLHQEVKRVGSDEVEQQQQQQLVNKLWPWSRICPFPDDNVTK